MTPREMRPAAQQTLKELETFQCESGGFAYWPGDCRTASPYLTAYVLHVFKTAADLKYTVDRRRARARLRLPRARAGGTAAADQRGWWPSYTAWQAFAVKVLVEGGRNQDSHLTRLYGYRERMPVFALAYLHDALLAKGETTGDARRPTCAAACRTRSCPRPAARTSRSWPIPYLLWFWNSNVRSTAIVLNTLVQGRRRPMRRCGRWCAG